MPTLAQVDYGIKQIGEKHKRFLNRTGKFKNWDTLCDELLTGPVHKDSKVKSKSAKVNSKAQVSSEISDDEYDWIMKNCR